MVLFLVYSSLLEMQLMIHMLVKKTTTNTGSWQNDEIAKYVLNRLLKQTLHLKKVWYEEKYCLNVKWKHKHKHTKSTSKGNLPLSRGKRNLGEKLPFTHYSTDTAQWVENLFSKCVLAIHFNLSDFKEGRQSLPNSSKVQGPPPPAATSQGKLTGEETAPFSERPDRTNGAERRRILNCA